MGTDVDRWDLCTSPTRRTGSTTSTPRPAHPLLAAQRGWRRRGDRRPRGAIAFDLPGRFGITIGMLTKGAREEAGLGESYAAERIVVREVPAMRVCSAPAVIILKRCGEPHPAARASP
jgi:hypothetical protein